MILRIKKQDVLARASIAATLLAAFIFSGCAGLKDFASNQTPKVSVGNVRLDKLSFQSVDLLFDLNLENPNPVGVTMAGFDYDFLLNESSFVKSDQQEKQSISANGSSTIQVPVKLAFADLYKMFSGFKDKDKADYGINFGFSFDVPILGLVRVPVSHSGDIPLLKLPKISLSSVKLSKLSFTGADLNINLGFENPNAFGINLDKLNYKIDLGGNEFATGTSENVMSVGEKENSTISLPVSLNFLKAGRSAYNLLKNKGDVSYKLAGDLDLSTTLPIIGKVNLPFNQSGQIPVSQ